MDAATWGAWIGNGLAVVGFGVTLWQLKRTRTAAEAASRATIRTERHLALNHLLVLLPQLQQTEADIETAVVAGEQEAARRLLARWRDVAAEVHGLIGRHQVIRRELGDALDHALRLATIAKLRAADQKTDLTRATARARVAMAEVSILAGQLIGELKAYTGGHDDD